MSRSAAWIARSVAVAAGAWLIYWACVMPFRCNRELLSTRVSILNQPAMDPFRAARMADQNLRRLNDVCRGCAPNVTLLLLLADNDELAGRTESVISDLDRAIAVQPRPEIFADRGNAKLELGRLDDAIADFKIAARFDPVYIQEVDPTVRSRVLGETGAPRPSR
jgi:tetratricopeptide (TPR) repeat protein